MFPATSTEGTIAFRMIHEPSGKPINYLKGIETEHGFEEVPEEEIIKGYEHTKGHHVLIEPQELDALKLEAKHTIDMTTFVAVMKSTVAISRSLITCFLMAMRLTKVIRCCVTRSPKPRRWLSANS
jgi:Ku70/Ku80 beta-barrel domain